MSIDFIDKLFWNRTVLVIILELKNVFWYILSSKSVNHNSLTVLSTGLF